MTESPHKKCIKDLYMTLTNIKEFVIVAVTLPFVLLAILKDWERDSKTPTQPDGDEYYQ